MSRFRLLIVVVALGPGLASELPAAVEQPVYAPVKAELVRPRQGLGNVLAKLKDGKPVKIAYLGGSITAAPGWRVQSLEWFRQEFPRAKVEEINACIGGTGSDLGVFRVGWDALRHDPDLMFVEFAVNDGGQTPERIWQAFEGIVRQTWAGHPRCDLCFVYTYRVGYEQELSRGECPRAASAMEQIAEFHGIPSVNFALKVVELGQAGKLVYQSAQPTPPGVIRFSEDGVHPSTEGHKIYTEVLAGAIRTIRDEGRPGRDYSSELDRPFVADHWQAAKMVPITRDQLEGPWHELDAQNPLMRNFGARMGPIWESGTPGSRLHFKFRGSLAKVYDLLGPDAGAVVVTADGQRKGKPIPLFDSYCTYHRIATLPVAENLDPQAVHAVTIEIHPDQPDRSSVAFRLKDPATELKSAKFQGTNVRFSQLLLLGDLVK